jgi:hypothetical protein
MGIYLNTPIFMRDHLAETINPDEMYAGAK